MKKRITSLILALILMMTVFLFGNSNCNVTAAKEIQYIDNSDLTPKYVTDDKVTLEGEYTPDWVKTLIMAEVRIETCTPEGTLKSAVKILDHYQEMGVNGLWITPVADRDDSGDNNGYINYGPHTIYPGMTGTDDYDKGWQEFAKFVAKAHERNIRIFLDITSWGVCGSDVPIFKEHPNFSTGYPDSSWGGVGFNWDDAEFRKWYKQVMIDIAVNTNVDGFRLDVEPRYAGEEFHKEVRNELLKLGRKISLMSELSGGTTNVYDFTQIGVSFEDETGVARQLKTPAWFVEGYAKIVDSVKSGAGSIRADSKRFFTYDIVDHDCWDTAVNGDRLVIGYQAIFAPYIPLWMMGEEFNGVKSNKVSQVYYFSPLDWESLEKNRQFYEDVKKMIRIRRMYPEIFNYYPDAHTDANICKVTVSGNEEMQAYARYYGDKAIIIVPNNNIHKTDGKMTVYLPFEDINLSNYRKYTITDVNTGKLIVSGTKTQVSRFQTTVKQGYIGVFEVKAEGYVEAGKLADGNYDETLYNENDFGDSDNGNDLEESDNKSKNSKKKKTIRYKIPGTNLEIPWYFIVIGALILIAAATIIIIIFIKKKRKKNLQ